MSWINDRAFWKDTAERVLSSAGQGLVTGAGLDRLVINPDIQVDLVSLARTAALGALFMAALALGKCLVTAGATKGNPSIGKQAIPADNVIVEKASDSPPTHAVAGKDSILPTGTMVDVMPAGEAPEDELQSESRSEAEASPEPRRGAFDPEDDNPGK